MRRRVARILLVLIALLVIAEVVYLIGGNIYLHSGRVEGMFNRGGKLSVTWESAWSLWPGSIHLRGLAVRRHARSLDWYAQVESVWVSLRLAPLSRRVVSLRHVSARGIDYRQRRLADPGAPDGASEAGLPPIPALEPRRETGAAHAERKPAGREWTIIIDRVDAIVDQVWLNQYRITGSIHTDLSMKAVTHGPIEFPRINARMEAGALRAAEETILEDLRLDVEASLGPWDTRGAKARDVTGTLDGRFQLLAGSARLAFLTRYLEKAPWLRFDGQAPLTADLRIQGGSLQPGSTLESRLDDADIKFMNRRLTGRGRIAASVTEEAAARRSQMDVVLDEFTLAEPGTGEPYAQGKGFKVTASGRSLDLADGLSALEVTADLPEAILPDFSIYNRYIPPGSGIAIRKGTGAISYHIEVGLEEKTAHGWIGLSADDLEAKFQNYVIRGALKIQTLVKDVSPEEGRFDISGTAVDLKAHDFPWTSRVDLPRAWVKFTEPLQLEADVRIRMTDTTPLVAIFDAQKDVSSFMENLLTIRDVQGRAALEVSEQGCEMTDVMVTGEDLAALADLSLRETGKDGIIYIKWRVFSVGVAFDRGKRDLDLVRARAWYDKQLAKRRGVRPAS